MKIARLFFALLAVLGISLFGQTKQPNAKSVQDKIGEVPADPASDFRSKRSEDPDPSGLPTSDFYPENSGASGAAPIPYRQLDRYFQEALEAGAAPGFSVVIVREDQVIFEKGYGREIAGQRAPMTAQTSTAIGSLTKSFTAMAMLQLVEQGQVRLDDPVIRYLPEFRTANKTRSDKITVRMLLNNSSGLPGGVSQRWQEKGKSLELLMESLQSVYLKREPGSAYEYSNTAFSIAGLIIGRVSGLSYADYLRRYIFQPLDMNRTTTDPADFDRLHVLYGHWPGLDGGIPAEPGIESLEMAPAGSLLRSSAADLGHYLIALLNGGRYRDRQVLSPRSLAALWSPQIRFPGLSYEQGGDGRDYQYGMGWMISEVEGRTLIHHGGSTGTMSSLTVLLPERKLAASILINLDYYFVDRYRFPSEFSMLNNALHLLENEPLTDFGNPRVPDPTLNDYELPLSLRRRLLGTYRFSGQGDARHFQGAKLDVFTGKTGNLEARIQQGKTTLLHFALDFTNEVQAVSRHIGAAQSIRFKVRPDGAVTAVYVGGSAFLKLLPEFLATYQRIERGDVSFFSPKTWTWTFQNRHFTAVQKDRPELSISGGWITPESVSMKALLRQHFPDHTLIYEGAEMTEVNGRYFWRQQSFATRSGEQRYQHVLLVNDTTGFYLLLTTPYGALTEEMQSSLGFLMDTFS